MRILAMPRTKNIHMNRFGWVPMGVMFARTAQGDGKMGFRVSWFTYQGRKIYFCLPTYLTEETNEHLHDGDLDA